jgi:hypothetical protein
MKRTKVLFSVRIPRKNQKQRNTRNAGNGSRAIEWPQEMTSVLPWPRNSCRESTKNDQIFEAPCSDTKEKSGCPLFETIVVKNLQTLNVCAKWLPRVHARRLHREIAPEKSEFAVKSPVFRQINNRIATSAKRKYPHSNRSLRILLD